MRRAASLLFLVTFFSLLFGCKPQEVMQLKRRPKTYQKIVSLSPSTTEILTSGLQKYTLAGRTASDNWPTTASGIPIVASVKPDYEKLATIRPDLIVLDGDLYGPQDLEKLEALGADIFSLKSRNLESFNQEVFDLSMLVGGESAASTYVDKIHTAESLAKATPLDPKPKVAIVLPSPNGDHMIAGTNSFQANLLKSVGATPVGPEADIFVKANPETLISLNPDFIFVNGSKTDTSGAEALLKDPRLQSVKAIREKKVRVINSDVLLRRGGRVDLLITGFYQQLAQH